MSRISSRSGKQSIGQATQSVMTEGQAKKFAQAVYEPGMILRRQLPGISGILCWHWGVYVGENQVIHFNGMRMNDRNAIVVVDTLEIFAQGKTLYVHHRPSTPTVAAQVCRKARRFQRLGRRNGFNYRYDLLKNNCQDFCVACYRGATQDQWLPVPQLHGLRQQAQSIVTRLRGEGGQFDSPFPIRAGLLLIVLRSAVECIALQCGAEGALAQMLAAGIDLLTTLALTAMTIQATCMFSALLAIFLSLVHWVRCEVASKRALSGQSWRELLLLTATPVEQRPAKQTTFGFA